MECLENAKQGGGIIKENISKIQKEKESMYG